MLKYKETYIDIVNPTIEKCTFDEMYHHLDMFWYMEYLLRVHNLTVNDENMEAHMIYQELPLWLKQYYAILLQYKVKKNNDKN